MSINISLVFMYSPTFVKTAADDDSQYHSGSRQKLSMGLHTPNPNLNLGAKCLYIEPQKANKITEPG